MSNDFAIALIFARGWPGLFSAALGTNRIVQREWGERLPRSGWKPSATMPSI